MRTNEDLATIIAGRIHAVGEDLLIDAETMASLTSEARGSSGLALQMLGERLTQNFLTALKDIEETMSKLGVPA